EITTADGAEWNSILFPSNPLNAAKGECDEAPGPGSPGGVRQTPRASGRKGSASAWSCVTEKRLRQEVPVEQRCFSGTSSPWKICLAFCFFACGATPPGCTVLLPYACSWENQIHGPVPNNKGYRLVIFLSLPEDALQAKPSVSAYKPTLEVLEDRTVPSGFLQICNIAGAGVAPGTNFTFNVGGTTVTVPAGPAPGGRAGAPIVVPAGPVLITETVPPGTTLTSVSTLQAGSLVSSNLAAGTTTVTVAAGGQTIVTFVDTVPPSSTSTPSFSNLSAPTITYGMSTTTISGHLGASSPFPTGSVSITINGVTKTPSLASDGSFSTTFDTHAL